MAPTNADLAAAFAAILGLDAGQESDLESALDGWAIGGASVQRAATLASDAITRQNLIIDELIASGVIGIMGKLDDVGDLPAAGDKFGEGWVIPNDDDVLELHIWTVGETWENVGPFVGLSAYNFAVQGGYAGSQEDFADDLAAAAGAAATETARAAAEAGRVAAESDRVDVEAGRVLAEAARVTAEDDRDDAEDLRAAAETVRLSSEATRVANESARVSAEDDREDAEAGRVSDEAARDAAEDDRADAEALRASAETTRLASEASRVSSETARAGAEDDREDEEAARVLAEGLRVVAEDDREDAEAARATASAAATAAATAAAALANGAAGVAFEAIGFDPVAKGPGVITLTAADDRKMIVVTGPGKVFMDAGLPASFAVRVLPMTAHPLEVVAGAGASAVNAAGGLVTVATPYKSALVSQIGADSYLVAGADTAAQIDGYGRALFNRARASGHALTFFA